MIKSASLREETNSAPEVTNAETPDFLQVNTKYISLVTYAEITDIEKVIREHEAVVEGCTYIFHDRDKKEPHKHIAVVLKRARRIADVIGWFKECTDNEGKKVNTQGQKIKSLKALKLYFLHKDEKSTSKGKFQYSETDLIVLTPFKDAFSIETTEDRTGGMSREEKAEEENSQLIEDMLRGASFREMACRYGRDYMKNYKAYREYCACILLEENGGDLDEALGLMGTPIQQAQQNKERQARNEGIAIGERDTYLSIIGYLTDRIKKGDTYLTDTLEVIRITFKNGGYI